MKQLLAKIVDDSKWNGTRGGRCITDYARLIQFQNELTEEELSQIKTYLAETDCPGWTGILCAKLGNGLYRFSTTWDSSD